MSAVEEPLYYAKGRTVWKRPVETKHADGRTGISLGFPICVLHEAVGDAAAETVARLMNAGQAALDAAEHEEEAAP